MILHCSLSSHRALAVVGALVASWLMHQTLNLFSPIGALLLNMDDSHCMRPANVVL